jgi:hypothetical protein
LFGNHLFEFSRFTPKVSNLAGVGLPDNIASQALLAGFAPIKILDNAVWSEQLGNAVFASQSIQNNADFLLRTVLLARLAFDVTNDLLGRRCSP